MAGARGGAPDGRTREAKARKAAGDRMIQMGNASAAARGAPGAKGGAAQAFDGKQGSVNKAGRSPGKGLVGING